MILKSCAPWKAFAGFRPPTLTRVHEAGLDFDGHKGQGKEPAVDP